MIVSKCPECGGEIQATVEMYLSEVTLNGDGTFAYVGSGEPNWADPRIYCENDHDLSHLLVVQANA